jgi:hypothetical protein
MPCVLATGETVPRAGTKLTMVRPNACGSPRRTMTAFKRQPSRCAKGGSGRQNRRKPLRRNRHEHRLRCTQLQGRPLDSTATRTLGI